MKYNDPSGCLRPSCADARGTFIGQAKHSRESRCGGRGVPTCAVHVRVRASISNNPNPRCRYISDLLGIPSSTWGPSFIAYEMQLLSPERSTPAVHAQISSSLPQLDDQAAGLNLLDIPKLPLAQIWQRICQLPMCDRCALLATCKAALCTFGAITDRMERLQLMFDDGTFHGPTDRIGGQLAQGGGARVSDPASRQSDGRNLAPGWIFAQKVLLWFPNATIGRLELHFASAGGRRMLRSFTVAAAGRLRHVTALELNGPHIKVRKFQGKSSGGNPREIQMFKTWHIPVGIKV